MLARQVRPPITAPTTTPALGRFREDSVECDVKDDKVGRADSGCVGSEPSLEDSASPGGKNLSKRIRQIFQKKSRILDHILVYD